ncbi:MAG: PHP domain-containing protein [Candidatus Gastranaerophilales bacterium]|nr:PHP domain-containing protein [Candidatus Gastranaerophilales bacterium]
MKVDLHIHTCYSDGAFSPEKIVDCAIEAGLGVIAVTDHDNVLSYGIASEYAKDKPLEILPGVEINTLYKGYEVHILGYFMDLNNSDFQKLIKNQQQARVKQTKEIIYLLSKKAGIKITYDSIIKQVAEGGSIGRPHIAKAITNAGGTSSVIEAYNKYINDDSNVYVQRKTVSPFDAVEVIYDAGGIPVFAHPFDVDIADKLTVEMMNFGLRGLEAYHRKHSPAIIEYFSTLAEKYGLIVTGGSDFHAPNPNNGNIIMGKNFVPDWIYDELMKEKRRMELAK